MKSQQKNNLPVIALDTGSIVGRVERPLLPPAGKKVNHLLIQGNGENPYFLLPFSKLVTMGSDALVVQSADTLVAVQADDPYITGAAVIVNQEVVSASGTLLGRALEYTIDDKTGDLLSIDCFDYELREKTSIDAAWLADDMGTKIVVQNIAAYRKRFFPAEIQQTHNRTHEAGKKTAGQRDGKKPAVSSYEMTIRKIMYFQNEMKRKLNTLAERQISLEHRLQDFAYGRDNNSRQEELQIKIGALLDRQLSLEETIQELAGDLEAKTSRPDVPEETRQKVSQVEKQLQTLEKSMVELSQALERHTHIYSRREDVKRSIDALSVRLLTLERIQQDLSANMSEINEVHGTKQEEAQARVELLLTRQLALEKQQQEWIERVGQSGVDADFQVQLQQKWDAMSARLFSMEKQQQEMYAHALKDRQMLETLYASLKELRAMAMKQARKEPQPSWEPEPEPSRVQEDPLLTLQSLQHLKDERLNQLRGQ